MPFLVIRSEKPGLICLNGRPAGETSQPLILPVAPEGVHWITLYPFGEGCQTLRLTVSGGQVIDDDGLGTARVTGRAGGAWEIYIPDGAEELQRGVLPKTLEDVRLGDGRVSLVEQDGLSLAVEDIADERVVAWHELKGWVSATLSERMMPPGSVMVVGHDAEGQRVAVVGSRTGSLLMSAACDEIESAGDPLVLRAQLGDVAGHVRVSRFTWENGSFREEKHVTLPERKLPQDQEQTALALVQALALDQEHEALRYITESMRSRLEPGRLALSIGPFSQAHGAGMLGEEFLVELIQPVSPRYSRARLYAFKMRSSPDEWGAYKVDDLRCVEG